MRRTLISLLVFLPFTVLAAGPSDTFASDAVALLDRELPQMNRAVAAKDRTYFGPALEHVQAFLHAWEKREGGGVLDRNTNCTDAVTDFLVVGLCKISPPGTICEPATFFPKVEANIQQCRKLAASEAGAKQK